MAKLYFHAGAAPVLDLHRYNAEKLKIMLLHGQIWPIHGICPALKQASAPVLHGSQEACWIPREALQRIVRIGHLVNLIHVDKLSGRYLAEHHLRQSAQLLS